jgi:hypothetical protein
VLSVIIGVILFNTSNQNQQEPAAKQTSTKPDKAPEPAVFPNKPNIPPPKFRVYRSKLNEGTSVVVAPATTDEQLKSLLWLFREKVRSHRFKDIGITKPTSTHWGKKDYLAGTIDVFRGEKCANENFSDTTGVGPCGRGEHSAAYYQWGLLVDGGSSRADADEAGIYSVGGDLIQIFDYKDNWQLPPELQAGLDEEKKAAATNEEFEKLAQKLFAEELEGRLRSTGFDITVRASDQSGELVLDSDIFKDTAKRVEFLGSVLPKWRPNLCKAGFKQVRLMRGGLFSTGDAYSMGCK